MGQCGSVAALTPEEKVLIKESWAAVSKKMKPLAVEILSEFFTEYPEEQKRFSQFADVPFEELGKEKKFLAHSMTVLYSLSSIIDQIDSDDIVETMVAKQVTNHHPRGITLQHYKNLESVISKCLDKRLTVEAKNAWSHGFDIFNAITTDTLQGLE